MLKLVLLCLFMIPMRKSWLEASGFVVVLGMLMMNVGGWSYSGGNLVVDWLSSGLVLLSVWMVVVSFLGSYRQNSSWWFNLSLGVLMGVLVITFSCQSILLFYVMFEASLIPLFFLILGWGVQPERLQAGIYFLLYTLVGSLPLLVSFIYLYGQSGSSLWGSWSGDVGFYVWWGLIVAFLMKLPLFLVHLWLPKAHVEAPLAGSMVLAGVTLKLGVYGMVRFLEVSMSGGFTWGVGLMVVGGVGSLVMGMVCLRQVDLKALIAYSSVSHMGVGLLGVMVCSLWGLAGAYWLLLAHGLASSGMFALANISYSRVGSRSIYMNKGLLSFMPSMSMWWFLMCVCNMASPPSLNLLSEMLILVGVGGWSFYLLVLVLLGGYLSACYSLYVFSVSQHGLSLEGGGVSGGYCSEYLVMLLHWLPLNLVVVMLYMVM